MLAYTALSNQSKLHYTNTYKFGSEIIKAKEEHIYSTFEV